MISPPRFVPAAFQPTDEQRDIQTADGRIILIEANAGAAKTTTICLRIGESLARGVPPQDIIVLVFTTEARDVMRRRLVEIGIAPKLAEEVRVETFEGYAEAALREFEGNDTPRVDSASQLRPHVIAAIEQVSEKQGFKYGELDIATHNVAVSQFIDRQLAVKARMARERGDWESADVEEIAESIGMTLTHFLCLREYEAGRLGPFDEASFRGPFDATYDLARYLDTRPEILNTLRGYRIVACDELHDMNEASFRILVALLGKDRSYFVGAGDKDQVIHATLGADAQFIQNRFEAQFRGVHRLPLTATFRHGPSLALAAGTLKHKPSHSALSEDIAIKCVTYRHGEWAHCADRVVEAIRSWEDDTGSTADCAILIRDSHQSIVLENALMRNGIGYRTDGMLGYLLREEILFLRGMLAIALKNLKTVQSKETRKAIVEALDTFAEVDRTTLVDNDNNQMPFEKAKSLIADDPDILDGFFSAHLKRGDAAGQNRIADVVELARTFSAEMPADAALQEIWSRINLEAMIKRIYVYPHDAEVVIRSARGFVDLAAQMGMNLKDFSEWVGGTEGKVSKRRYKSRVTLSRVETSKGKEYAHVILPLLESGEFPSTTADSAEEENLFYVGITRAKARLTMLLPDLPARQSVFVERMGLGAALSARAEAAVTKNANRQTTSVRVDLKVPYEAKNVAKELGARWDPVRKTWFVEAGVDLAPFQIWIKP